MVRVHNVASVLLISMPCVHRGPVIEWRWEFTLIELACLIPCDLNLHFSFVILILSKFNGKFQFANLYDLSFGRTSW